MVSFLDFFGFLAFYIFGFDRLLVCLVVFVPIYRSWRGSPLNHRCTFLGCFLVGASLSVFS